MPFFDPEGNEISIEEWGRLFHDPATRTMARDDFDGKILVTVWLGFVDASTPGAKMFGTAVKDEGGFTELEVYDTKDQATEGHQRHLEQLRGQN